jgi:peptidyl-prolyl cis-trans isomerase SDCCAG10
MSQVYATEPSTSGRVLVETTHGPLEIQLWCRECPLTTRFFLQLALDGFYDDMSFHRIVPDFLIQTGAIRATNNNNGMNAAYREEVHAQEALERRKYEVHSRLRFNHRGQVAMALGVSDESEDANLMQPQFFITLDEAPYLDGKHVLFGTVVGPTMFNALRIGRTHVGGDEPVDLEHAPRIVSIKIVDNPVFTDLVPQASVPWKVVQEQVDKKRKKKRKGKRDLNVLSFGNEMQEDEEIDTAMVGMKSSHDVVQSQALSNQVDDRVKEAVTSAAGEKIVVIKGKNEEIEGDKAAVSKSEVVMMKKEEDSIPAVSDIAVSGNSGKERVVETAKDEPAALDESHSHAKPPKKSAVEARLAKYKKKPSTDKKQREEDTMAKLLAFQGKVRKQVSSSGTSQDDNVSRDDALAAKMARKLKQQQESREEQAYDEAPTYHGQMFEHSDEEGERSKDDWLSTKFKCRKHMDIDSSSAGADGRTMDDYQVVDDKRNGHDDRGDDKHGHHRDRKRLKHHSKHRSDHRGKHG